MAFRRFNQKLKMVDSTKHILLTSREAQIFDTLSQAVDKNATLTTIRVSGGWVRDKILGLESDDIDLSLDNMSGEDFAKMIQSHEKDPSQVCEIIKSQSDKAKHLETALVHLQGQPIDIVHLRDEVYKAGSRHPEITVGTPEQDAFRRDLTVNSMFYNVRTRQIEDWTGKGFEDLKNKVARTPQEPL